MIGKLLRSVARLAAGRSSDIKKSGLPDSHPLIRFFAKDGETVKNYLALDDTLVFGAIDAMSRAEDADVADMAIRLRERKLYKTLDMAEFGEDPGKQRGRLRRIREKFADQIEAETIMLDDKAAIGIYAEIGGDEERMHKKLHILDGDNPVEISKLSPLIEALGTKKQFTRLYFADATERDAARK